MRRPIGLCLGLFIFAVGSAAAETIHLQCFDMKIELVDGMVEVRHGNKTFLLDDASDSGQFMTLLDDLTRESVDQARLGRWTAPGAEAELFDTTDAVIPTLGSNAMTSAEAAQLRESRTLVNKLLIKRGEMIKERAAEIKRRSPGLHLNSAKEQALGELRLEKDFTWNEVQLRHSKSQYLDIFRSKLEPIGIDLGQGPQAVLRGIAAADPFSVAGRTGWRDLVPFNRGEKIDLQGGAHQANVKGHFGKHASEFSPPIRTVDEYFTRGKALADSKDPRIISFRSPGNKDVPGDIRIAKYNPATNEYLIVSKDGNMVTYFRPNKLQFKNLMERVLNDAFGFH